MFNKYIIGAFLWALGILVLTLTPGKSVPDISLFSYDKIGHGVVFLVFSALLAKGLFDYHRSMLGAISMTLVIAIGYGMAIELTQTLIPDRSMEWYDALANTLGSFLGLIAFYMVNREKA